MKKKKMRVYVGSFAEVKGDCHFWVETPRGRRLENLKGTTGTVGMINGKYWLFTDKATRIELTDNWDVLNNMLRPLTKLEQALR